MRQFAFAKKHAALAQQRDNNGIRFENRFAPIFGQSFDVPSAVVERGVGLKPIFLPGLEVFQAMAWRGMHDTGTLIEGHIIGQHGGDAQIQEGVLEFEAREIAALPRTAQAGARDSEFLR